MLASISWAYIQKFDSWVITVAIEGKPVAWVFRKKEEECREWADKHIMLYARGTYR